MTQEDKELLLRDFCARLPYNVKGNLQGVDRVVHVIDMERGTVNGWAVEMCKPYLRSFKSMTKDERSEYYKRCKSYHYKRTWKHGKNQYGETLYKKEPMSYTAFYRTPEALDYLNSIHVDYRGLIKKGLALKAEPGMYDNTENETNR